MHYFFVLIIDNFSNHALFLKKIGKTEFDGPKLQDFGECWEFGNKTAKLDTKDFFAWKDDFFPTLTEKYNSKQFSIAFQGTKIAYSELEDCKKKYEKENPDCKINIVHEKEIKEISESELYEKFKDLSNDAEKENKHNMLKKINDVEIPKLREEIEAKEKSIEAINRNISELNQEISECDKEIQENSNSIEILEEQKNQKKAELKQNRKEEIENKLTSLKSKKNKWIKELENSAKIFEKYKEKKEFIEFCIHRAFKEFPNVDRTKINNAVEDSLEKVKKGLLTRYTISLKILIPKIEALYPDNMKIKCLEQELSSIRIETSDLNQFNEDISKLNYEKNNNENKKRGFQNVLDKLQQNLSQKEGELRELKEKLNKFTEINTEDLK